MDQWLRLKDAAWVFGRGLETMRHWVLKYDLGEYGFKIEGGPVGDRGWRFDVEGLERFFDERASEFLTAKEAERIKSRLEEVEGRERASD